MNTLTAEAVEARRRRAFAAEKVMFRVSSLYGLCPGGIEVPLDAGGSIETGDITITVDPDADTTCNLGMLDFGANALTVRYGVQAVFPALHELASERRYDARLLNPVRMVATDQCTVTTNLMGWRALGCLDFLAGSVWSGATGG